MGSHKCGIVGKSQSILIVLNPIIFTRTRSSVSVCQTTRNSCFAEKTEQFACGHVRMR
jgi:hypothetical protein